MTIDLWNFNFKTQLNKLNKGGKVDLHPSIIDEIFNDAIRKFVDNVYKEFDITQETRDQLATLVIKDEVITPIVKSAGVYEIRLRDLSNEYLHYLSARIKAKACSDLFGLTLYQLDDLNNALTNTFTRPMLNWRSSVGVIGEASDGNGPAIYIYTNGEYVVESLTIDYLKTPTQVSVGGYPGPDDVQKVAVHCDLPDHYHNRMIDLAVNLAQGYLENAQGYQISSNILNT